MFQERFSFPLPNDGENYRLTKAELVQLLEEAYQHGVDSVKLGEVSTYSTFTSDGTDKNISLSSSSVVFDELSPKEYDSLDEFRYTECAYCGSFACSDPSDEVSANCRKLQVAIFKNKKNK